MQLGVAQRDVGLRFSARYILEIRRETQNIGNYIVERMSE